MLSATLWRSRCNSAWSRSIRANALAASRCSRAAWTGQPWRRAGAAASGRPGRSPRNRPGRAGVPRPPPARHRARRTPWLRSARSATQPSGSRHDGMSLRSAAPPVGRDRSGRPPGGPVRSSCRMSAMPIVRYRNLDTPVSLIPSTFAISPPLRPAPSLSATSSRSRGESVASALRTAVRRRATSATTTCDDVGRRARRRARSRPPRRPGHRAANRHRHRALGGSPGTAPPDVSRSHPPRSAADA